MIVAWQLVKERFSEFQVGKAGVALLEEFDWRSSHESCLPPLRSLCGGLNLRTFALIVCAQRCCAGNATVI